MDFPELCHSCGLRSLPFSPVRDSKSHAEDRKVAWKGRLQRRIVPTSQNRDIYLL